VNIRHTGFDVPPGLKLMAALGYLRGSNVARPLIHILEQMAVDGAQVRKVEAPSWYVLGCALADKSPLGSIEQCRICDPEFVAENG
jgi:hypothetical protein